MYKLSKSIYLVSIVSLILVIMAMYSTAAADVITVDSSSDVKAANAKITSLLLSEMAQAGSGDKISVIIMMQEQTDRPIPNAGLLSQHVQSMRSLADTSQQDIIKTLRAEGPSGVSEIKTLWAVNAVAAKVTPATITKIAQRSDVIRIEPDLQVTAIDSQDDNRFSSSPFDKILNHNLPMISMPKDKVKPADIIRDYPDAYTAWGVDWIEAPELWACGINGSGVNVSIIDTGINAQHPDLQGKVVAWKDFTRNIPFTGTSAWHSGKGDNLCNTLTGTFDLSGVTSATLEFEGRYEMEYEYNYTTNEYLYYDYGYVNVSIDNGVTWDTIEVYQGLSDGYLHEVLDLTAYAGEPDVMVRFVYVTDEMYHWDGWYIDDITISEIGFFDGAESGMSGWTIVGWEIKDNTVYYPTGNIWHSGTGDYLSNTLEQSFDLSGLTSATLAFTSRYDIESDYDYGYVQISTGSGWITLADYTGCSDWIDESFDLSSYTGSNITIRFLYSTDYGVSYEGWFVDNIEIPEIEFSDDAESDIGGWTADGWYIFGPDIPYDDHGHGTHVAGTVAGTGADGMKTGVAPGANLMAAKVLGPYGGALSDVIRGVEWSVENGADVVSLSLGMNPVDGDWGDGILNESETAIENITVFTNLFESIPYETATPTAYQPTYIIGLVGLYDKTEVWGAYGGSTATLTRTFDLSSVTTATLEFGTAYYEYNNQYVGEVQASTDGIAWNTLTEYHGDSWTGSSLWVNESLSLDEYIGSNVILRFVFDPYYGGVWQIDNIAIPEIGFYDDVETGNTGWTASGWFIDVITTPLDTTNANILLSAPDGTPVSGDEMDWLFEGMVPENVWIYKYTANAHLQAGEWDLTITSNFNGTLDYDAQLLVGYPTDGTDAGSLALDTAASLGVVPIVAAGNEGDLGLHTVCSPGASASAVTVGATDYWMDYIAWFSSRGPVGFGVNEIIKPDVVAPGTRIGSTYYLGGYQWWSGTSMATPHVAGAAALLLQADPSLTPAQVKQTLMDTSVDLGEIGTDNTYGAGRISAYAAVNATVDLPDPVYAGPDNYELFAGATVDEISVSPFITDNVGDAGGEVDIRQVEAYTYSDYLHFKIITSDTPDLSNSEFYLDLDTDRNPATGAVINDIGADYRIKLNSTGGYLYRMNADEEEFIGDVSIIYSASNCIYAEIYLSNIGQTSSNASFFGVARTGGVDTDTAPDTGHGVYPYADIPIKMVGISWSDETGAPQAGTNITFSIYQDYPYYGCVFNSTVQTDSSGMATADYVTSQMNPYGFYYVTIQDDKGNSVYDYVYTFVSYQYDYEPPFMIPTWYDYYCAVRNSTLTVKLTMVTPEWEPYNDNVTLVFGSPWSINNVSAYLTPVNGTIEYDLDLAGADIDEYNSGEYYNYIPVRVLNGTLDSYDYIDYVGDVSIIDANFSGVMLDPWAYSAVPGETLDLLVQTMNPYFETPASKELDGMVYWIREIDVKALGEKVSPAVLVKLDEMRKSTEQGEHNDLLSDEEKAELRKGLAEIQNLGIDYSFFEVCTDITGMAKFNITVPQEDQGVYYGFVYVFDDTGYGSGSFVFVRDPDWHHHTQAPPESNAYYLSMWVDWKANRMGEQCVPEDNFTVNLELCEYNSSTGWRAIPNEPVQLYTTTRETKTVTTDLNGMASINFTAPDVDILNSTWDERCVQVWGITGLLQNGIAVADSGWGHLYIPYEYVHNRTPVTLSISNSELDIHVEYQNSTGYPITDVPSVLDVRRGSWWSVGDMLSEYVRSSITTYDETISLSDYGTYSATVASEYKYIDYWSGEWTSSFTMWYDQITYHPFNITTDMMPVYGRGLTQPITVTVRDASGTPMEGVSVYIVEDIIGWVYEEANTVDYYWSHVDLDVTDASGEATLLLKTPYENNVWVQYRIGGATSEYSMPYLRSGIFSVMVIDKSDLKPIIDMPSVVEAGTETSITGKVYNYGDIPSNNSVLSLYVDDEHLTDISIGAIQPYGHASFSQPWTPASEGTYQIKAVADATDTNDEADESNNIATKAVTARLPDNIAPVVTIDPVTSPTNVSSQTITGTFNESGSGIDLITVNGVEASISGTAYSATIGLTEGTNPVDVIAVDNAGNSGSNSTTIVLDTIAPAITIDPVSSPTNINSQTITGNFSESGSGLASITVDSVVATISGTAYSATISLSEGSNIVNVVATDNAGNQNTATATIDFVSTSTEFLSVGSANALANSTITIPVSVANVENVSGITFDLLYNSSVVIVSNVNASENFTGSSITPNIDNTNGITRVVLTNSDLISASTVTPVIDIVFNVTGGFGSSTSLDLQNVEFSGIEFNPYTPAVVVDGMITVGIKGDFNGNGRVDIGDVAKVAFMVAGKIPEDLNADFNGNGRVDIGDAAKIAFYLAGKVSEL